MTDSTLELNSNNLINDLKSNKTPVWVDDIIFYEDLKNAYHVTSVNKSSAPGPVPPRFATAGAPFFLNNPINTHEKIAD